MVSVCHYTSSFITLNETVKQRPFTVLTNGIHSQSNEKEKKNETDKPNCHCSQPVKMSDKYSCTKMKKKYQK